MFSKLNARAYVLGPILLIGPIVLGFVLMDKTLGRVPAFFGSLAWISTLGLLLIWENYPEEYALPLQFATWYIFHEAATSKQAPRRRALMMGSIGLITAACFLLKPTLVGTGIAAILVLLWRNELAERSLTRALSDVACVFVGILLALAPVTAYFWSQGVLEAALDAVFRYNLFYSAASPLDRLLSVLSGLGGLPALSGAPALALIAYTETWGQTLQRSRHSSTSSPQAVVGSTPNGNSSRALSPECGSISSLALASLPIELLLVAISGRSYGYYYTAWLPVFGVLCALFARNILSAKPGEKWNPVVRMFLLGAFLPVIIGIPSVVVLTRTSTPITTDVTRAEAVQYVKAHTNSIDSVLMWGAEPGVNFAGQRRSPSRFAYQYALLTTGYTGGPVISDFVRELETDQPALIIDASSSDKITPPIDVDARQQWKPTLVYSLPPEMDEFFQFVDTHYQLAGSLGPDNWQVYTRIYPQAKCGGQAVACEDDRHLPPKLIRPSANAPRGIWGKEVG